MGDLPLYSMQKIDVNTTDGHKFHTFVAFTPEQRQDFSPAPEHAKEHDGFSWLTPEEVTSLNSLHPGFQSTLQNINLQHLQQEARKKGRIDEEMQRRLMEFRVSKIDRVFKQKTTDAVRYFFTDEQFQTFQSFLSQDPYNEQIDEDHPFVAKVNQSIEEDDEQDISDEFASLNKRKRSGDIEEPFHQAARDPEEFVDRGWVVEVPQEVLEQVQELVVNFEQGNPEKFEEAKNWYQSLNQVTQEVADSEAGQVLLGVLLALGSINTPFLTNMYEAAVMFAGLKHDLDNGNGENILKLLNEDWDQKFALKQYKDAMQKLKRLRDDLPDEIENHSDEREAQKIKTEMEKTQEQIQKYRRNIQQNQEQGYHDLATYYLLNQKILSPLRSKTSGKLFNVIELAVSKGGEMSVEDAVNRLQDVVDFQTKNVRDLKPDQQAFLRGMKVANFALNIIQPDLAEDRMNELNTTIDTWMVKALWPGVSYSKVSGDPFAYYYLASQTAKLARKFDLLTQEMQAVIWVAMIDEDKPDALVTAGALAEAIVDILEYLGVLEDTAENAYSIGESLSELVQEFQTLEDFKTLKAAEMKSIFHGAAVSGKSPKQRDLLQEKNLLRDHKKYAEIVSKAYEARPVRDPDVRENYEALVDGVNNLLKDIKQQVVPKIVNNYQKIGYRSAEDMRDRVEESGVLLVDKNVPKHPLLNQTQFVAFRGICNFITHVLAEQEFGPRNKLRSYNLYTRFFPSKSYPALFTEIVGESCAKINTGRDPSPRKACLLHGFDYDKVGRVDWQKYQKNFEDIK